MESPWTFGGESASVGGNDAVTLVDGRSFVVCDRSGDIPGHGARGLFMFDTRVLSRLVLTVNGMAVQPLMVTPNGPFSATFVGRIDDPAVADAPVAVIQRRHVGHGLREDIDVRNHGAGPLMVNLEIRVGSDFGGLLDVKAGREGGPEGTLRRSTDGGVLIDAAPDPEGGTVEATIISFETPPERVENDIVAWQFELRPGERWTNCLLVGISVAGTALVPTYLCGRPVEDAIPVSRLRQWRARVAAIETDNTILAAAVNQAAEDLGALRIFDAHHPERVVIAAGAPWFMTLFGRDSLLASWMALPLDQDLAKGVLMELADFQGVEVDPITDQQPGRILHEVRLDQKTARLLGGSDIYYGSIDATALFVMLVAELARWTGVTPTVTALLPAVDRALAWVDDFGDRDGDGFVEYLRGDPTGLENQGWKDSWDGVRHADGTVAAGPIALCEVQSYVYAALRGRAELARALGEPDTLHRALDARADRLRSRFNEAFWLDDVGWFAMGLDGDKNPIRSLTSNIGHVLWSGLASEEQARRVADHLAGASMFTGWGIRTLADENPAYNPLSYHCGSVWPHDTALAVAGLSRYHCDREAHDLTTGLLAASTWTNGRLPELFAGFDRTDLPAPVPYPASCSPQAWASASPLLLVRAMLGLEPNVLTGHFRLRPRLPPGLDRLRLVNVPIGGSQVDISVDRDVVVQGLPDELTVEIDAL